MNSSAQTTPTTIPRFVLDASVIAACAIPSRYTVYTHRVQLHLAYGEVAMTTQHWMMELLDELLLAENNKETTQTRTDTLISNLAAYRIVTDTIPATARWVEITRIARSLQIPARQAMTLELALRTKLPLATLDPTLLRVAANAGVAIYNP